MPGWTSVSGTWTIAGDAVVVPLSTAARMTRPITIPTGGAGGVFVEIGFDVSQVQPLTYVGLFAPAAADFASGNGCALRQDLASAQAALASQTATSPTGMSSTLLTSFDAPLGAMSTAAIRLERRGTSTTCVGTLGGVTRTGATTFMGTLDHIGLAARGVAATIRYVIVYTD